VHAEHWQPMQPASDSMIMHLLHDAWPGNELLNGEEHFSDTALSYTIAGHRACSTKLTRGSAVAHTGITLLAVSATSAARGII